MSIDYNTYIGPFVEVHNPSIPATETVRTCSNKKCREHKNYQSGNFCSTCGVEIKDVTFDSEAPLYVDEDEEFNNALTQIQREYPARDDYDIWIDNLNGSSGVSYDPENDNNYTEIIDAYRITTEIEKFRERREKEINRLKEIFGAGEVSIKWGVVGYTH